MYLSSLLWSISRHAALCGLLPSTHCNCGSDFRIIILWVSSHRYRAAGEISQSQCTCTEYCSLFLRVFSSSFHKSMQDDYVKMESWSAIPFLTVGSSTIGSARRCGRISSDRHAHGTCKFYIVERACASHPTPWRWYLPGKTAKEPLTSMASQSHRRVTQKLNVRENSLQSVLLFILPYFLRYRLLQ